MRWFDPSTFLALAACACAPLLGACGPMTDIYVTSATGPDGQPHPLGMMELDVEECRPERGSPEDAARTGFLAIGSSCQVPIQWLGVRSPDDILKRFTLAGGPFHCTLGNVDTQIRDIHGVTVGNDLHLTLDTGRDAPETVELRGERGDSRPSQMLCGAPAQPYTVSQR